MADPLFPEADLPPSLAAPAAPASEGVRVLQPRRAAPADAVRPTRAEINLAHLRHNLHVLERTLSPVAPGPPAASDPSAGSRSPPRGPRAAVWGVLKADAYGHGAPAVARTLERAGVAGLCVALLEEALELRAAGIRLPILVMGGYYGPRREGLDEIPAHDLTAVVYDPGQIERLATLARDGGRIGVHLKVDTGMGRLGATPGELEGIFDAFERHPGVRLDGLMTHLACADADDLGSVHEQLARFAEAEAAARARGLDPRVRHAANSAALLRVPESRRELVRPGIALFGVSPLDEGSAAGKAASAPGAGFAGDLRPVMRVRTEVVAVRSVGLGQRIGYGHTWQAARPSVIATLPMGYADGLDRQLSNRGHVLVRGKRAPIVGTVSMDLAMVDLTDHPGARVGDEAVVLGAQEGPLGRDAVTAAEVAALTGRIPWEVVTSISRRVPRFYREP